MTPYSLDTLTDITTSRLTLRLMDPMVVEACLDSDIATGSLRLGALIPDELLDHPSSLMYSVRRLQADPGYLPWAARAIILTDENLMIGIIRFHSCPGPEYLLPYAEGAVEIGYRVFSDHRKQGFATEALNGLMEWAREKFNVQKFVLAISPANTPSLRLAKRFGFMKVGEEMDDIDGIEYVFLLDRG